MQGHEGKGDMMRKQMGGKASMNGVVYLRYLKMIACQARFPGILDLGLGESQDDSHTCMHFKMCF
jgi:hypothetical protein